MSRNPKVVVTVLCACLTLGVFMAIVPAPAVGQPPDESSQQVAPQHEVDEKAGPENRAFPFLYVYLWKDDDNWDDNNCIGVFPNPAVISESNNKPHKIRWVILEKKKETGESEVGWSVDYSGKYEWLIEPKSNQPNSDLMPPKDKKIKKGHNSFKSGKPSKKGYWDYKITVKEEGADCSAQNSKCCTLDPKVRVRG
jgi:hypothetical protein